MPTRTVREPCQSFDSWLVERGIPLSSLATDDEHATYIGGMLFPTSCSSAQLAKIRALGEKVCRREELYSEYVSTVDYVSIEVELDLTKESDAAYLRCLDKRRSRLFTE